MKPVIDYEKKYKEALERAKDVHTYYCDDREQLRKIESIFPELAKSEEENELKWLIQFIQEEAYGLSIEIRDNEDRIKLKNLQKSLAWLEKQDKQNPTDNTKLKFHKWDWVIFNENNNSVYQVERIANNRYYLRHYLGGTLSVHFDVCELIRLWTAQDAKEGDVLVVGDEDGTGIAICGKNDMLGNNVLHCYYDNENDFAINVPISSACLLHPATKEQRDALFKIITENGYKWDNVKKYLKKKRSKKLSFEQNPT